MSNAELVDRMQKVREAMRKDGWDEKGLCMLAVNDAITALSSQDDVREKQKRDYFNDTAQWRDCAFETAAQIVERYFPHGEWEYITDDIRALKSKPTTEERRNGVEDRRKSEFGNLERAPEVKGQSLVDEWAAYRVNIDWERPATMLDLKIAMRAVGDELDTRLGEKS